MSKEYGQVPDMGLKHFSEQDDAAEARLAAVEQHLAELHTWLSEGTDLDNLNVRRSNWMFERLANLEVHLRAYLLVESHGGAIRRVPPDSKREYK